VSAEFVPYLITDLVGDAARAHTTTARANRTAVISVDIDDDVSGVDDSSGYRRRREFRRCRRCRRWCGGDTSAKGRQRRRYTTAAYTRTEEVRVEYTIAVED